MSQPAPSVGELQAQIEAARRRLESTVDELAFRARAARARAAPDRVGQAALVSASRTLTAPSGWTAWPSSPLSLSPSSVWSSPGGVVAVAAEPLPSMAASKKAGADKLPIRMLHDRVLVSVESDSVSAGPAGASSSRRRPRSANGSPGPSSSRRGPRCATSRPTTGCSSTLRTATRSSCRPQYILLREKDIHAVAASRVEDGQTGLYL